MSREIDIGEIDFGRAALMQDEALFIARFLRFEFALKSEGFIPENGRASVEWGRVAKELGPKFFAHIAEAGLATTIMERPPMKQIAKNHQLEWEDQRKPQKVHELIEALCAVRNNLFHGGKSGDLEGDRHRSGRLIAEAQLLIEHALHWMPNVKNHFEGRY